MRTPLAPILREVPTFGDTHHVARLERIGRIFGAGGPARVVIEAADAPIDAQLER